MYLRRGFHAFGFRAYVYVLPSIDPMSKYLSFKGKGNSTSGIRTYVLITY